MIDIQNIQTLEGVRKSIRINGPQTLTIDATELTLFPGLIDPHVHFRTPGHEYKEDWRSASQAAIRGGYTTVFDMPNNNPACITQQRLLDKRLLIDQQLQEVGIPLRYHLFFGADKQHFAELAKVTQDVIGIKIFMGSSTGDLMMDDDASLDTAFAIAAQHNMLVAVHAEDEALIQQRTELFKSVTDYAIHSVIRTPEVAAKAVAKAISLTRQHGTTLYILHVSTQDEIELIAQAKADGLPVYAETTPHHLFLHEGVYSGLAGKAKMNPPLRSKSHQQSLLAAIHAGIIDTIGSDHAPHTLAEKQQPYCSCPAGVPGIETTLPLLLNAHQQGLLSLDEIIKLTHQRARTIFQLPATKDYVLVDLTKKKTVTDNQLKTKCGWSPFAGLTLQGWPVYTILGNQLYACD